MRDLSLSLNAGAIQKKTKTSSGTKILNLSVLVAIIFFGLVYFFQINAIGTKGYEIQKLQAQIKVLQDQQKSLQLQASDLQSITRIQDQAQALGFVPSTSVTYLKSSDFALK